MFSSRLFNPILSSNTSRSVFAYPLQFSHPPSIFLFRLFNPIPPSNMDRSIFANTHCCHCPSMLPSQLLNRILSSNTGPITPKTSFHSHLKIVLCSFLFSSFLHGHTISVNFPVQNLPMFSSDRPYLRFCFNFILYLILFSMQFFSNTPFLQPYFIQTFIL